jgi:VanZ family protein
MGYLKSSMATFERPTLPMAWFPVFLGLSVISIESTAMMSGANTSQWLLYICHALWGQTDGATFETIHFLLRKLGHFSGYGVLALLFRRAWYITLRLSWEGPRSRLPFSASALAVMSTFLVACVDEIHQSFLPGRTSSFLDVMIDTAGAVLFVRLVVMLIERRRRATLAYAYA